LLEASATADDRQVSRGFKLFDHQAQGIANLATIAGGKLTTFRLMAEKTADLVAQRLNNSRPCKTATEVLPAADPARWTEPGFAPREWFRKQDPTDAILCECEMVPQSAVHSIIKSAPGIETEVNMQSIGVRSRVGKGSCQGSFCSIRINSWLYEQEIYRSRRGLLHTRHYVAERFKGIRPILWGEQMPQMELAEALHCGLLGLDLIEEETDTRT
jgi:glycerol-3-phosphate dehydrogenase